MKYWVLFFGFIAFQSVHAESFLRNNPEHPKQMILDMWGDGIDDRMEEYQFISKIDEVVTIQTSNFDRAAGKWNLVERTGFDLDPVTGKGFLIVYNEPTTTLNHCAIFEFDILNRIEKRYYVAASSTCSVADALSVTIYQYIGTTNQVQEIVSYTSTIPGVFNWSNPYSTYKISYSNSGKETRRETNYFQTQPFSAVSLYTYNSNDLLELEEHTTTTPKEVYSHLVKYNYDSLGDLSEVIHSNTVNGVTSPGAYIRYFYDPSSLSVKWEQFSAGSSPTSGLPFFVNEESFDSIGRLLSKKITVVPHNFVQTYRYVY